MWSKQIWNTSVLCSTSDATFGAWIAWVIFPRLPGGAGPHRVHYHGQEGLLMPWGGERGGLCRCFSVIEMVVENRSNAILGPLQSTNGWNMVEHLLPEIIMVLRGWVAWVMGP